MVAKLPINFLIINGIQTTSTPKRAAGHRAIKSDSASPKIFPDKNVRNYFIDQTCEVFRGGNRDKIAMFWTGNGNNGKSVTQRLFETMLGKKLAIKLSTSVLTERIQPGNPNPQLTRLRGGV